MSDAALILWQVTGARFCAGLVTRGGVIVDAAPILRSLGIGPGVSRDQARVVARHRGFRVAFVCELRNGS